MGRAVNKKLFFLIVTVLLISTLLGLFFGQRLLTKHLIDKLYFYSYTKVYPPLVKIEGQGGLCPNGICTFSEIILKNGTYVKYNKLGGKIDASKLSIIINATDFNEIYKNKFTGVCPTAYDAMEITYTFYTSHGKEVVSSCSVKINPTNPLFVEMKNLYLYNPSF